jgi:hypothetical protein
LNLTIFHYHLLPGGVTGVIAAAGSIAISSLDGIRRLRLVCGRQDNADAVAESIREASFGSVPVELLVHPEIDYLSEIPERHRSGLSREIEGILGDLSDPEELWWVHNHHIGKNPAFTDALLRFARTRPEQRIVLQIHDFPESGRYANLAAISQGVAEPLYPVLENLRYVVLNNRDYSVLAAAGIPESVLSVLPNPVRMDELRPPEGSDEVRVDVMESLGEIPGDPSRRFHRDGRLAVYPVRCIRRKNVLEAALLSELAGKDQLTGHRKSDGREPGLWNLVVTLPGTSDQERRYSEMVEAAFDAGLVAGRFAPGTKADIPFRSLLARADAILSSSVQEGFGYTYIEAVATKNRLIARYIDILSGVDEILAQFAVSFYHGVPVPFQTPSLSDIRPMLRLRYGERLEDVQPLLPPEIFGELSKATETLLAGDTIDFSFLMPQMQYTVLKDLDYERFATELIRSNGEALAGFRAAAAGQSPPEDLTPLREQFGFPVYGRRVQAIVGSFDERRIDTDEARPADAQSVLSHFATIDYLRLLYAAM